ncbi:retrovirus-related Pol polyprotein from type-2 retrotransposable element R2DM [Nephila pilipes]|uniref:Retrovirus-related Pol polyprotein from type-2 retrotransposable element R2DM n=1 Tax=Nephila pilipes TaxID=299642 RepID=A0A8X6TDI1_NEPPI|nr:retrovirus-related Pol polyprotein from type-2 retrotransposable element R2DM [Nephila pilipes]
MAFVTKNGLDVHQQKVHYLSPQPPVQTKLFISPEEPTCQHEIEDGMTFADHCKIHHNLEVSTDRASPVSKAHEGSPSNIDAKISTAGAKGTKSNHARSTTINKRPKNIPRRDPRSDSSLEDFEAPTIRKSNTSPPGSPTKCPNCPFLAMKKGGLRLHMFRNHNTVVALSEITAWGSTTTQDAPSSVATTAEQHHQCKRCATICKTAKGLRVHMQSAHNISVRKEGKSRRNDTLELQQSTNADQEIAGPPNEVPMEETPSGPKDNPVTLVNNILKYSFPLHDTIRCPERKCHKIFHTRKWYTTNNSVKRHLSIYHRIQLAGVEYWCTTCKRRISGKPASHPCISNAMTSSHNPSSVNNIKTWVCADCGFKASSRVGLDVHRRIHKRDEVAHKGTPLVSLPTPKQRKLAKNRKIAPLLVGSPGDLPLDRPLPTFQDPSDITVEETLDMSNENALIDIPHPSILDSFLEPLEALMNEDIDDRLRLLEVINNDITSAIQQHFHLEKREASSANKRANTNDKKEKLKDPQTIQKAYAWNRRKCIRDLVESNDTRCSVPTEVIHSHFTATWAAPSADSSPSFPTPPELPPIVESFTEDLVCECLKAAENTAPGPDLVAYKHWREADPKGRILSRLFNICLSIQKVPASWKQSDTVLIHKKGDQTDLSNWRPIALSNTVYKLFSKCLTRKLLDWCSANQTLSSCQKGFTPFDGVLEHNFTIAQHLEDAHRLKRNSFACWIDISNAFGSIPHSILWSALRAMGTDLDFIALCQDIYKESFTSILGLEGKTPPIPLKNGIKQGCPMSGILFDIAIDHVLRLIQGDEDRKKILAFADDIVLLANSQEELQENILALSHLLEAIHLKVNGKKCATLHLSGTSPVGAKPTAFFLDGKKIKSLGDGDHYQYLVLPYCSFLSADPLTQAPAKSLYWDLVLSFVGRILLGCKVPRLCVFP